MSARSLSLALALAAALGTLALTAPGRAEDPVPCRVPERGGATECGRVPMFDKDFTATLVPNNRAHLTPRVFSHFTANYGGTGTFRAVPGLGFLVGVAPFGSQIVRFSAGLDATFGPTPDGAHQDTSIEPRGRVSFGNFQVLPTFLPADLYVTGVAPYWTHAGQWGWGVGGGASVRLANRIAIELGYEGVRDPEITSRSASPFLHRVTFSLGIDALAWVSNRSAYPVLQQQQIDLRCAVIALASEIYQHATAGPSPAPPPRYCGDVEKALLARPTRRGETATAAFLRHLSRSEPELCEQLRHLDDGFEVCKERTRTQQRRCVDCTSRTLKSWPSYVMDPHQLAEALGCIAGAVPADVRCSDEDTANALAYQTTECHL